MITAIARYRRNTLCEQSRVCMDALAPPCYVVRIAHYGKAMISSGGVGGTV